MNQTLDYYNAHANRFFEGTASANMKAIYEHFLKYLQPNARILDLGCGSGRDSRAFIEKGYDVVSVDGSEEICKLATKYLGRKVECVLFQDIHYQNEFDAVWACASMLHVDKEQMPDILCRVANALKDGGTLYVSYKYGNTEREIEGRHFSDYTEKDFTELFNAKNCLSCVEWWTSEDVRPNRTEKWLNIICKKEC